MLYYAIGKRSARINIKRKNNTLEKITCEKYV